MSGDAGDELVETTVWLADVHDLDEESELSHMLSAAGIPFDKQVTSARVDTGSRPAARAKIYVSPASYEAAVAVLYEWHNARQAPLPLVDYEAAARPVALALSHVQDPDSPLERRLGALSYLLELSLDPAARRSVPEALESLPSGLLADLLDRHSEELDTLVVEILLRRDPIPTDALHEVLLHAQSPGLTRATAQVLVLAATAESLDVVARCALRFDPRAKKTYRLLAVVVDRVLQSHPGAPLSEDGARGLARLRPHASRKVRKLLDERLAAFADGGLTLSAVAAGGELSATAGGELSSGD